MGKIVLDLGLHKTGSTFRQKMLYPKIKKYNTIVYFNLKHEQKIKKNSIISDETFSGSPIKFSNAEKRFHIAMRLKKLFPEASIILCLREKNSWIRSLYTEHIRNGYTTSFNDYKEWLDQSGYLEIDEYVKHLKKLFNNVYICHYEDLKKDYQKYCKGICDFLGTKTPKIKNIVYRKGYSNNQINIIRVANYFLPNKISSYIWKRVTILLRT